MQVPTFSNLYMCRFHSYAFFMTQRQPRKPYICKIFQRNCDQHKLTGMKTCISSNKHYTFLNDCNANRYNVALAHKYIITAKYSYIYKINTESLQFVVCYSYITTLNGYLLQYLQPQQDWHKFIIIIIYLQRQFIFRH